MSWESKNYSLTNKNLNLNLTDKGITWFFFFLCVGQTGMETSAEWAFKHRPVSGSPEGCGRTLGSGFDTNNYPNQMEKGISFKPAVVTTNEGHTNSTVNVGTLSRCSLSEKVFWK